MKKRGMMKYLYLSLALILVCIQANTFAQNNAPATNQKAILTGLVMAINEGRIEGAKLTITGKQEQIIYSSDDGSYRIELKPGLYNIEVHKEGYCPVRRAAFNLESQRETSVNFALNPCATIHGLRKNKGKTVEEFSEYQQFFKEESFLLKKYLDGRYNAFVQYGKKERKSGCILYSGAIIKYLDFDSNTRKISEISKGSEVILTLNAYTIRAQKIKFCPDKLTLSAEGNVKIEDGEKTTSFDKARIDFSVNPHSVTQIN